MAARFWRYAVVLIFVYCNSSVAAVHVPLQLEFHHYDPETVQLLNAAQYNSANTETNLLLFKQFSKTVSLIEVPMARSELMMDSGESICTLDRVLNSNRSAKYLFSKPVNFYLGYRLYQLEAFPVLAAELLNNKGQVKSIAQVMQKVLHAKLLVPEHFSFGEVLDQQIRQLPAKQILPLAAPHYHTNFIGMFASKRAEFAIAYPSEMSFFLQDKPQLKVRSYGIETAPELITGHLMCTKTEQNRKFIQAVDQALTLLYRQKSFLLAHTRYLDKQEADQISRLIRQYFNE
jgi:uncharacterized protein (TIGR02285 family)